MGTEPRPIPIPSKDVRVEAAFAGQAIVTHVAGIRLGTVERVRGGRDPARANGLDLARLPPLDWDPTSLRSKRTGIVA